MDVPTQTLAELGWRSFFSGQISSDEETRCIPVRVIAVHRGKIAVAGAGFAEFVDPHLPGANGEEDHPTVGDWLLIDRETRQPIRVLDRENLFKRRAPGPNRRSQKIAANVDTLFVVASCNQDFSTARLERYLILAREVGVNPVVVLTKADLTDSPEVFETAARQLQPDLVVRTVNARDPDSVASLASWCGMGDTVALLGSSGVGKSTLVNSLRRSDSIATQEIRKADGTGRHTTTVREMHRLDQGGWLLDTPGMRELQLTDAAAGLAEVFDDIATAVEHCRFSNCAHVTEPGCGVQAAVARGEISEARLDRWRRLTAEEQQNSATLAQRRRGERT
jgi:ribosome biogenesis GTPase